jgi:hypothetical protein
MPFDSPDKDAYNSNSPVIKAWVIRVLILIGVAFFYQPFVSTSF